MNMTTRSMLFSLVSILAIAIGGCTSNAKHQFSIDPATGRFEGEAVNEEHNTTGSYEKTVVKEGNVVETVKLKVTREAKLDAWQQSMMAQTQAISGSVDKFTGTLGLLADKFGQAFAGSAGIPLPSSSIQQNVMPAQAQGLGSGSAVPPQILAQPHTPIAPWLHGPQTGLPPTAPATNPTPPTSQPAR